MKWPGHFKTWQEAMKAADAYLAHQREYALQPHDQPDVVIGDDKLDMFWYLEDQGTDGVDRLYLVEHAGWICMYAYISHNE